MRRGRKPKTQKIKKSNNLLGAIIGALILIAVAFFAFLLGKQDPTKVTVAGTMQSIKTTPTAIPSASPAATITPSSTPTPTPDKYAGWNTFNNGLYSLRYPQDWIATESSDRYFGDEVMVTNKTQSVVLRVLSGKQPYGFGPTDFNTTSFKVTIEGKEYIVQEHMSQRTAFVDTTIKKGEKYQILFGTGYPTGEDRKASIGDYKASKETLLLILSSLSIKDK